MLDEEGLIKKVRGGAIAVKQSYISNEFDVSTKLSLNVEEKSMIAKYAARTIKDDDFVFIDAGTTTEAMIDFITCSNATYVTNGMRHAQKLIARGFKTYIIGGRVKPSTEAIVGAEGIKSMQKYNFTKSFLGTNGIHLEHGFSTVDTEEASIKEEATKRSYVSYILADHSKFDVVTAVTFAKIDKCCIVTDKVVKDKYKNATFIKEVREG